MFELRNQMEEQMIIIQQQMLALESNLQIELDEVAKAEMQNQWNDLNGEFIALKNKF